VTTINIHKSAQWLEIKHFRYHAHMHDILYMQIK